MKKQLRIGLISLAVFALWSVGHSAPDLHASAVQPGSPIGLHLSVEKQSAGTDRQPQWTALAGTVQPGDELRYTVQVRNQGVTSVRDLVVTQPVPAGMTYRADSATGSPLYSLDGKTFSAQPTVPVRQAGGTMLMRPAAPETFAALRWRFAVVTAGSVQSVTYQVKVR